MAPISKKNAAKCRELAAYGCHQYFRPYNHTVELKKQFNY